MCVWGWMGGGGGQRDTYRHTNTPKHTRKHTDIRMPVARTHAHILKHTHTHTTHTHRVALRQPDKQAYIQTNMPINTQKCIFEMEKYM